MLTIETIKDVVKKLKGREVIILMREQRGKIETRQGVLSSTFQSFFNISTTGSTTLQYSYTYVDVLTNEISIQDPETDEMLLDNRIEEVVTEDLETLYVEETENPNFQEPQQQFINF